MMFTNFTAKKMMASLVSIGAAVAVVGSANSTLAPLASNCAENWELSQQKTEKWGGVAAGVSGLRVKLWAQSQSRENPSNLDEVGDNEQVISLAQSEISFEDLCADLFTKVVLKQDEESRPDRGWTCFECFLMLAMWFFCISFVTCWWVDAPKAWAGWSFIIVTGLLILSYSLRECHSSSSN